MDGIVAHGSEHEQPKSQQLDYKLGYAKRSSLVGMPPAVLLEIFRYCLPQDLIFLTRTTRLFCAHLSSPVSSGIWKAARKAVHGPPLSPGMTEQEWAHLVFGEDRCQSCGQPTFRDIDFGLQRRACVDCWNSNLIVYSQLRENFPDIDPSIVQLLRHTNYSVRWRSLSTSTTPRYWHGDVKNIVQELDSFERDIEAGVSGAQEKMDAFVTERKRLIQTISEYGPIYARWQKAQVDSSDGKDTEASQNDADSDDATIDAILAEANGEALASQRAQIAEALYTAYKNDLHPRQWEALPRLSYILEQRAFKDVIESKDAEISTVQFAVAVESLPAIISSFQAARTADLLQLIQNIPTPDTLGDAERAQMSPHPSSLDSALAVFACQQPCRYNGHDLPKTRATCIGREAAAAHHCGTFLTVFALNKEGVRAASALVKTAGLDDQTTTCAQMDSLDGRFLCQVCGPRSTLSGGFTFVSYPWRAAIAHFVHSHQGEVVPRWELLDSVRADNMKRKEFSTDYEYSWACCHCPQHVDQSMTYSNVVEHIREIHEIVYPAVPADLIRLLDFEQVTKLLKIPGPPKPPVPPPKADYSCLRCNTSSTGQPEGKSRWARRLFDLGGVKNHLRAKHKIYKPVEGQDWGKVPQV